jgi:PTS system mannose-specific IID component
MKRLSRRSRVWATLRLLFLQGAWNFERLQNLGFAWCVEGALRELYPDTGERRAALKRHLELFNTHPYMAGYVVGAALRAEAEAPSALQAADAVTALKMGLSPALAAVGDSFFWATLRPAAGMMAVAWLWLAPHPWHLAAPLVFLTAYNLPGLWLRLHSLEMGWQEGDRVALHVAALRLPALTEGMRMAALMLAGALAGALARVAHPATGGGVPLVDNFLFLGAGLGMMLLLRLSVRPLAILLLCVVITLVLAVSFPG